MEDRRPLSQSNLAFALCADIEATEIECIDSPLDNLEELIDDRPTDRSIKSRKAAAAALFISFLSP